MYRCEQLMLNNLKLKMIYKQSNRTCSTSTFQKLTHKAHKVISLLCMTTCLIQCSSQSTCNTVTEQKLPKLLYIDCTDASCMGDNVYAAVTGTEDSIYLGGSIRQPDYIQSSLSVIEVAALTRIDLPSNSVQYTMTYSQPQPTGPLSEFNYISGLALNPASDKLAIAFVNQEYLLLASLGVGVNAIYIMVVNTADGSQYGTMKKLNQDTDGQVEVKSNGLAYFDDGTSDNKIWIALHNREIFPTNQGLASEGSMYESRLRIAKFDPVSGDTIIKEQTAAYGRSVCMLSQIFTGYSDVRIYLGGSSDLTHTDDADDKKFTASIVEIEHTSGIRRAHNVLQLSNAEHLNTDLHYYIDHMAIDDTLDTATIFGTTQNINNSSPSSDLYLWGVDIDRESGILGSDLWSWQILNEGGGTGFYRNKVIGIKPLLEQISSVYFCMHVLLSTEDTCKVIYFRACSDDTFSSMRLKNFDEDNYARLSDAFFPNTSTHAYTTAGGTNIFAAYMAGAMKKFEVSAVSSGNYLPLTITQYNSKYFGIVLPIEPLKTCLELEELIQNQISIEQANASIDPITVVPEDASDFQELVALSYDNIDNPDIVSAILNDTFDNANYNFCTPYDNDLNTATVDTTASATFGCGLNYGDTYETAITLPTLDPSVCSSTAGYLTWYADVTTLPEYITVTIDPTVPTIRIVSSSSGTDIGLKTFIIIGVYPTQQANESLDVTVTIGCNGLVINAPAAQYEFTHEQSVSPTQFLVDETDFTMQDTTKNACLPLTYEVASITSTTSNTSWIVNDATGKGVSLAASDPTDQSQIGVYTIMITASTGCSEVQAAIVITVVNNVEPLTLDPAPHVFTSPASTYTIGYVGLGFYWDATTAVQHASSIANVAYTWNIIDTETGSQVLNPPFIYDPSSTQIVIQVTTSDVDAQTLGQSYFAKTWNLQVQVEHDFYTNTAVTKDFTVVINGNCVDVHESFVITLSLTDVPVIASYAIGNVGTTYSLTSSFTANPAYCISSIVYGIESITPTPNDATAITVTNSGSLVLDSSDTSSANTYQVQIYAMNSDNIKTFHTFQSVELLDQCGSAVLEITCLPLFSKTVSVEGLDFSLTFDSSCVSGQPTSVTCPALEWSMEIDETQSGWYSTFDSAFGSAWYAFADAPTYIWTITVVGQSTADKTTRLAERDINDGEGVDFRVKTNYVGHESQQAQYDVTVYFSDCQDSSILTATTQPPPADYYYDGVLEINPTAFTIDCLYCEIFYQYADITNVICPYGTCSTQVYLETVDPQVNPPTTYSLTLIGQSFLPTGSLLSRQTLIDVVLVDPCPTSTLSLASQSVFNDQSYTIGSTDLIEPYLWVTANLVTSTTIANCGTMSISFIEDDSPLSSSFLISSDSRCEDNSLADGSQWTDSDSYTCADWRSHGWDRSIACDTASEYCCGNCGGGTFIYASLSLPETDDETLIGTHSIYYRIELALHPAVFVQSVIPFTVTITSTSTETTTTPAECQVSIEIVTPTISSTVYYYGQDPVVISFDEFQVVTTLPTCDYIWRYTASLDDGSEIPSNLIGFNSQERNFEVYAAEGVEQTLDILLVGELLSNLQTAEVEFQVAFLIASNTAPVLESMPESQIVMTASEGRIIDLGPVIDFESDTFIVMLISNENAFVTLDTVEMKLKIGADALPGNYSISIELQDFHENTPMKTVYEFSIEVLEDAAVSTDSQSEMIEDGTEPTLSIYRIDKFGQVEVRFSEYLEIPQNTQQINDTVFELTIESQDQDRQDDLRFTWSLKEFYQDKCKLQINFTSPLLVSSELEYQDQLQLKVIDPVNLLATDKIRRVENGTTSVGEIPPQVILGEAVDNLITTAAGLDYVMSGVTAAFISANTVAPFLLGSMSILWGLINSLQIVAYIPLLNVKMPANATIIYEVVYTIANFKLFSSITSGVQEWVYDVMRFDEGDGSESTEVTENTSRRALSSGIISPFAEYSNIVSNDPLVNLSLAILVAAILLLIIGLLFLIYCLFKKNEKVRKICITIKKRIWMNMILRYMLEHYLLMVIAYMLKMTDLNFTNKMEGAMSTFSIAVFLVIIAMPFIIWRFIYASFDEGLIKDPAFHEKYGSLFLDLHRGQKHGLLFNVFYMLRRIAMAFIIIALPNMNWLQRQLLIFKCSLMMIFTGYFTPFKLPYHDKLEIANECLILVNTYFMIIYSGFVQDEHAKYVMGWANLAIIISMVILNLIELLVIKGYGGYRWLKLKLMGRQRDKRWIIIQMERKVASRFKAFQNLHMNMEGLQYNGGMENLANQVPTVDNFMKKDFDHIDRPRKSRRRTAKAPYAFNKRNLQRGSKNNKQVDSSKNYLKEIIEDNDDSESEHVMAQEFQSTLLQQAGVDPSQKTGRTQPVSKGSQKRNQASFSDDKQVKLRPQDTLYQQINIQRNSPKTSKHIEELLKNDQVQEIDTIKLTEHDILRPDIFSYRNQKHPKHSRHESQAQADAQEEEEQPVPIFSYAMLQPSIWQTPSQRQVCRMAGVLPDESMKLAEEEPQPEKPPVQMTEQDTIGRIEKEVKEICSSYDEDLSGDALDQYMKRNNPFKPRPKPKQQLNYQSTKQVKTKENNVDKLFDHILSRDAVLQRINESRQQ